jgi:hypothetical protein
MNRSPIGPIKVGRPRGANLGSTGKGRSVATLSTLWFVVYCLILLLHCRDLRGSGCDKTTAAALFSHLKEMCGVEEGGGGGGGGEISLDVPGHDEGEPETFSMRGEEET